MQSYTWYFTSIATGHLKLHRVLDANLSLVPCSTILPGAPFHIFTCGAVCGMALKDKWRWETNGAERQMALRDKLRWETNGVERQMALRDKCHWETNGAESQMALRDKYHWETNVADRQMAFEPFTRVFLAFDKFRLFCEWNHFLYGRIYISHRLTLTNGDQLAKVCTLKLSIDKKKSDSPTTFMHGSPYGWYHNTSRVWERNNWQVFHLTYL